MPAQIQDVIALLPLILDLQDATVGEGISLQPYIDTLSVDKYKELQSKGLTIDGRVPKEKAAMTLEPEYIAIWNDMAYVNLQVRISF